MRRTILVSTVLLGFARLALAGATQGGPLGVPIPLFPADNWWNTDISQAPVDAKSAAFITHIGAGRTLHPDFGGCVDTPTCGVGIYGFPYVVVTGVQASDLRKVLFDFADESDGVDHQNGDVPIAFYPIPDAAKTGNHWIEGGEPGNQEPGGDRHMLIVDKDQNFLYELYALHWDGSQWTGGSGAFFDMNTNNRRPDGWTSADAAGLAILPGLVRYDEVYGAAPEIGHAFRVTVSDSNGYVFPGSHNAGSASGALPMGARLRLKASTDISGFTPEMQKIFRAMKKYGLVVADNGSNMYISGTFDTNWDNDILNPAFGALSASDFEVVELGWPTTKVSVTDAAPVSEGDASTTPATFTVTLSPASLQTVTVNYATANGSATAGNDYVANSGTLTFAPGVTSLPVDVQVKGDTLYENDETFSLNLSSPVNAAIAAGQGQATIVDDDTPPSLSIGDIPPLAEGNAGAKNAVFTVTLSALSGAATTVDYASADGTATVATNDYTPVSGTLTIPAGALTATISVPVKGDTVVEDDETFSVNLSNPNPAAAAITKARGVGTIKNDDVPGQFQFSAASYTVSEAAGFATITVKRAVGTAAGATVQYATSDGTATGLASQDYTPTSGTLTFGQNQTSLTFKVLITKDVIDESNETVLLRLSNPQPAAQGAALGSPNTAVLTITDNDVAGKVQFALASYSVSEAAGTVKLTVKRIGGTASPVAVHYTVNPGTASGADYSGSPSGDLSFASNGLAATTQTITIPITQDSLPEGAETFTVALSAPTGGAVLGTPSVTTVTILDDEATLEFGASAYTVKESLASALITVKRSGVPTGIVTVSYATGGGSATPDVDYKPVSGILTFGSGVTSRTFVVPMIKDALVEGPETVGLTLTNPGGIVLGAKSTATLTIVDDDAVPTLQFGAASYTVSEATSKATLMVKRTGTLADEVTVDYMITGGTATNGVDYDLGSPGTLTFAKGVTTQNILVPIVNDALDEGTETVFLKLQNEQNLDDPGHVALGALSTTVLNITDNEPTVQFSAAAYSVSEAATSMLVTVKRTGGATTQATVSYDATGGTAVRDTGSGGDYALQAGILTFGPGQVARTFPITLDPDTVADGPKTIVLGLSTPTGAALGTPKTATVTIKDNDVAGKVQFSAANYSVAETAGIATITVTRTSGTSSQATVHYTVTSGASADPATSADFDATSGTLTFGFGEKAKTFTVTVHDDGTPDAGAVSVDLNLDPPGNGLALGTVPSATLWVVRE